jgi:hypothetical protein
MLPHPSDPCKRAVFHYKNQVLAKVLQISRENLTMAGAQDVAARGTG